MTRLLFILFFFSFGQLFALYTGNPASPILLRKGLISPLNSLFTITSGYIHTQVWDMDIVPKDLAPDVNLAKMGEAQMYSNLASVGINLFRRLELYSYLGVSKENIDWKAKLPFTSHELQTKNHFCYSVGAKAIMLQFGGTVFSLDFQYFTLPSTNKLVPKIVSIYMPIPIGEQHLHLNEWQIAAGMATKIGPFTPYVGGKYSHVRLKVRSSDDIPNVTFKNRRTWGFYVGASLNFSYLMAGTFEARFFDEKAISGAVSTVF